MLNINFIKIGKKSFLNNSHCCVIWNPYKEKYNEQIEKVQRRATKTLPKLNKLEYIDRLKKLKLLCLKYRRLRGDLIEAYKILRGSYDNKVLKIY